MNDSSENEITTERPKPPLSPWAQAMQTVSNITTAVLLILVCGGLGFFLDRFWAISLLAPLGCIIGTYLAVRYLLAVTKLK